MNYLVRRFIFKTPIKREHIKIDGIYANNFEISMNNLINLFGTCINHKSICDKMFMNLINITN